MRAERLGDHVTFLSGFAFDSKLFNGDGTGMPLIRIRDVVRGYSETFYSGDYDEKYVVVNGEYLIGMDGEFNLAKWRSGPALLNQRVCKIDELSEDLDQGYLAQCLPLLLKKIEDETPFVTVKHLSIRRLNEVQIPLPPLTEQKRIAGILDAADALRAKRRAALAELDTLLQSTFLDMFGDPVTNPMGWEMKELADVVQTGTIVTYGIVQAGDEFPNGVPYIRTGDIVDGEIDTTGLRHTNPSIAVKFERSRVRTGEIVMSIRATVGTTALVPPELDGANLTQGTARISPGGETQPHFLLHFIRTQGCQSWIQNQIKGATFREITLKRLRQMPVLVPPLDMQCRFTDVVESTERQKMRMRAHLTELGTLFASLQSKAFNGEL